MKRLHTNLSLVPANSCISAKTRVTKKIKQCFCNRKVLMAGMALMLFAYPFISEAQNPLRAPAYPLVTIDPYTSAWSSTDNLYDSPVKHWTGRDFPLLGVIRVDGIDYRFMGKETEKETYFNRCAKQLSADVQAMQTIYKFSCGQVDLDLTFTAPLFLNNLDLLSRPVNYITYNVHSNNSKKHNISLYFEASPEWALDNNKQESVAKTFNDGQLTFLCSGSKEQKTLQKKGDDVRIDWGYFYLASNKSNSKTAIGNAPQLREGFLHNKLSSHASDGYSKLALTVNLGKVAQADNHLLIGYDDIYSIQYFGKNLRPYWNRNNDETILSQFHKAEKEYNALMNECKTFDSQLISNAEKVGGERYADLCALAYRQSIAAQKLVQSPDGNLLFFPKENFSNGSIGTVDVIYPSSPILLLYNPQLMEAELNYIFYYSESGQWTKPFAAHDVGTYPIANGQTYGGDMPVEESGNMLILTAAIAKIEGNAEYAEKHWKVLTEWAEYLLQKGFNPDDQLCTDDFAGHIAHNTNLSIKAIIGLASYGYLADMLGKKNVALRYMSKAREMAEQWVNLASDGDHYRLTFDNEGTWSQKYNMVWDKILGFDLFPSQVAKTEINYYLTKQNKYGLPLDNRKTYTKTDWVMWTATLAKDKPTFEKFASPIYDFMNETRERIPMSDWIYTDSQNHAGFQARSVVGGYFIKMLSEKLKDSVNTPIDSTCSGLIRNNFQAIVNNKATDLFVLLNGRHLF